MRMYTKKGVYEFIANKIDDPIVERKTCRISGTQFPITQGDIAYYTKIAPSFGGKTYACSLPTICPEERSRRRLLFRNERKLYRRKCDASKKSIISTYSPDKPYKVYDQKIWWSDMWNPFDYGIVYSTQKPFFEQFALLNQQVPKFNLNNMFLSCENSAYVNYTWSLKDCYLCFGMNQSQDCLYGDIAREVSNSIDFLNGGYAENCYAMVNFVHCSACFYGYNVTHCRHVSYSSFMENCSYCYGCYGLHNASYVINNIQYSPETYAEEIKKYTHQYGLFLFGQGKEKSLKRDMFLVQSEGCFGDLLYNSKDALFCYDCFATNSKYSTSSGGATDAYDTDHVAYGSTWAYESVSSHGSHIGFVEGCRESQFLYYCKDCHACISCFGCVGLRNKQYCIGNRQYTKHEYERIVEGLIEHMQATGERGEFFPHTVSCYGYNETCAQEAFPLSYEEALLRGYSWQEKSYDPILPEGVQVIDRSVAPGDIEHMDDQVLLQMVFLCSISRRPYRLTPQELSFYRKFSLPLPREHPDVRHDMRVASRPGRTLHLRTCTLCAKDIVSIYPETHEHNVYCEDCYTKEVYG